MNHSHPYRKLMLMASASFIAMYALMYAMVDVFSNVLPNYNQFYMAGLMAAPMVLIELWLMGTMYPNKRTNLLVAAFALVLCMAFWMGIREQVAINDSQFLKSMIPHHAAAILMCREASLEDPELEALCRSIINNQQAEIDFMKSKLDNY